MLFVNNLHIIEVWFVDGKHAKFKKRLGRVEFKNGIGICKRR